MKPCRSWHREYQKVTGINTTETRTKNPTCRQELSVAKELIFRQERIIIPVKLQRKVVKIGHSLGHLGKTKTKTKRMLRDRYWFPYMNNMIDNVVDQCYECQGATKETQSELIKTSSLSDKPWDTVFEDFGRPYPGRHCNLVIIDKRTRYPVVERVSSTSFQINKERLKHVFVIYGTPRRVESCNRAPFNSNTTKQHRYTPEPMGKLNDLCKSLTRPDEINSLSAR